MIFCLLSMLQKSVCDDSEFLTQSQDRQLMKSTRSWVCHSKIQVTGDGHSEMLAFAGINHPTWRQNCHKIAGKAWMCFMMHWQCFCMHITGKFASVTSVNSPVRFLQLQPICMYSAWGSCQVSKVKLTCFFMYRS